MSPIDTKIASIEVGHCTLFSRVWNRVVNWFYRLRATDAAPVDPTSHFSLREWADLPTHHPASDE